MMPVYINGWACVSAQETLSADFCEKLSPESRQQTLSAKEPDYKAYIPPAQSRRMSKIVKMSTVAAAKALEAVDISVPDAIIVGTGVGCEQDSEKFLKNLIENGEDFLTPTYFVQSTHNTVAGQIALGLGCRGYNFTYVNTGSSLEMSLLDAALQIGGGDAENILVGAGDEKTDRTMELYALVQHLKNPENLPADYLHSGSAGAVWGEGSAFFVIGKKPSEKAVARLVDTTFVNHSEVAEFPQFVTEFLFKNKISAAEIDAVLFGFSADQDSDAYYLEALKIFQDSNLLYFKHLCGEYNTASGFALFMANEILRTGEIPDVMRIGEVKQSEPRNILIVNNFFGKDHALTLLQKI